MSNRYKSNLAYLMSNLNISGKELSEAIHVDVSLISKWKNKKRKINKKAPHFENMIDYFIKIDETNQYKILKKIFLEKEIKIGNINELKKNLKLFILNDIQNDLLSPFDIPLSHNTNNDVYDYNVRIFKDNSGRREAVLEFLDIVLNMNEPQELLLISQEDMTWMLEDKDFLIEWNQKLNKILKNNHKVKIIHFVDREVEDISNVIKYWIQLYSNVNIESYYYTKFTDTPLKQTLFIVKNHSAIYGVNYNNQTSKRYTAMYCDDFSVNMYENMFNHYLEDSNPLITKFNSKKIPEFIKQIQYCKHNQTKSYFYTYEPSFIHFKPDLLKNILINNNVNKEKINEIIYFHSIFSSANQETTSIVYNFSRFNNLIASGKIKFDQLSFLAEKDIFINHNDIMQLLESLISYLQDDTESNIVIIDSKELLEMVPMNFIISANNFVTTNNLNDATELSFANELTTVSAFEYFFNNIWSSIPRISKDKSRNIQLLNKVIDTIKDSPS
jgi:transcriptional regulator with XRE-family HTH domain